MIVTWLIALSDRWRFFNHRWLVVISVPAFEFLQLNHSPSISNEQHFRSVAYANLMSHILVSIWVEEMILKRSSPTYWLEGRQSSKLKKWGSRWFEEFLWRPYRQHPSRANLHDLKFDFIINFPSLDIKGKYDIVFRLFGAAVTGRGDLIANFRKKILMPQIRLLKNLFSRKSPS